MYESCTSDRAFYHYDLLILPFLCISCEQVVSFNSKIYFGKYYDLIKEKRKYFYAYIGIVSYTL